jgi:GAF domain-containing protein
VEYAHIASALKQAAQLAQRKPSLQETLDGIVHHAHEALPNFDHVGLSTTLTGDGVSTHAATTPLVRELDALQYSLDEGPCVDTLRGAEVVTAPTIRHDQRWPRYVPRAVKLGLRSQLAMSLFIDEKGAVGGLNLYSTTSEDISPDAVVIAEIFAAHASVAFGQARQLSSLAEAIKTRQAIGVAIGIVMATYDLDEERATSFIWRAASTSNTKVRDVAARIVRDADEKSRPTTSG